MTATNLVLDRLAKKLDGASDYRLAEMLDVSKQAVSAYRKGRAHMSDKVAMRAAGFLGEHPAAVLAELKLDRSNDADARHWWKQIQRHYISASKGPAAVAAVAIAAGLISSGNSTAAENGNDVKNVSQVLDITIHYAKYVLGQLKRQIGRLFNGFTCRPVPHCV